MDPESLWLQQQFGRPGPLPRLPDPRLSDPRGLWAFLSYGTEQPTADVLLSAGIDPDWRPGQPRDPSPHDIRKMRLRWRVEHQRREQLRQRVYGSAGRAVVD